MINFNDIKAFREIEENGEEEKKSGAFDGLFLENEEFTALLERMSRRYAVLDYQRAQEQEMIEEGWFQSDIELANAALSEDDLEEIGGK